jgi:hypothetical protein
MALQRGLCDICVHQRLVPNTRGSVFSLCERSADDPAYVRYPAIPILDCPGFQPKSDNSEPPTDPTEEDDNG